MRVKNMEPIIQDIEDRKLVGARIQTTLAEHKTFLLWNGFKPRVKAIAHRRNDLFYSVQKFAAGQRMEAFTPHTVFEKWAAVEVDAFDHVPAELEPYVLPGGKYAMFLYKGLPSAFDQTAQYIFGTWLPNSAYELDDRPHFEIMGAQYRADDPEAEEEIWVPIRVKT